MKAGHQPVERACRPRTLSAFVWIYTQYPRPCRYNEDVSAATTLVPGEGASAQFKTLYQLLSALSKAASPGEVYAAALTSLLDATPANRAAILLFDDAGVMRFQA